MKIEHLDLAYLYHLYRRPSPKAPRWFTNIKKYSAIHSTIAVDRCQPPNSKHMADQRVVLLTCQS